jgi:predicted flap endonuclease-1-like 5' DNA nuclease
MVTTQTILLSIALQSSTENYLLLFLFLIVALIFFALFYYWWRGVSDEDLDEVKTAYANQTTGPAISGEEMDVYAQAEADAIADREALLAKEAARAGAQEDEGPAKAVFIDLESEPEEVAAVEPDDLKKIEGIGPKIEEVLNGADIVTFEQLAAADPDVLHQLLLDAGSNFHLADPTSWPAQAKLAALADWTGLEALQEKLVGGREE